MLFCCVCDRQRNCIDSKFECGRCGCTNGHKRRGCRYSIGTVRFECMGFSSTSVLFLSLHTFLLRLTFSLLQAEAYLKAMQLCESHHAEVFEKALEIETLSVKDPVRTQSIRICLSTSTSLPLCLCVSVSVFCISLCLCISPCVYLSLSLSLSLLRSQSLLILFRNCTSAPLSSPVPSQRSDQTTSNQQR